MQFGNKFLDLTSPKIMGILNVTPDSFSDGGRYQQLDACLRRAKTMVEEGADIIDIGGESTRPGAPKVSVQEELDRVLPIIEAIDTELDTVISIDTSKPKVMTEAVRLGAELINDVRALQQDDALQIAAELNVNVCLMHMQGQPDNMQRKPQYESVVEEVFNFLAKRIEDCKSAGLSESKLIVDPGFGFGKTLEHNYQLLANLQKLQELNVPVLAGTSRKSMLGNFLNRDVNDRLAGSIISAAIAAQKGAHFLRVHDVRETVDAVKIVSKVRELE